MTYITFTRQIQDINIMNTKAKVLLASTLLTALFAGQSAIAGQDVDGGYFEAEAATNVADKVNYSAPNATISAELDAELFPSFEGQ